MCSLTLRAASNSCGAHAKGGFPWPRRQTALLAAHLREDTADLLALLPAAVRRRAARRRRSHAGRHRPRGLPHAAHRRKPGRSRRALHRTAHPQPVCVTALAAAYVSGAAGCAAARCSSPNGLGRLCGPWEMRGCLPPHWVICWPTRCSMAASGPQYPCVRRGAGKRCFSLWPTTARDARPPPGTAAWALGLRLHGAMPAPTAAACWQGDAPERGACFPCACRCARPAPPPACRLYGRPLQSAVRAACACVRSAVVTVRPPECSVPAREAVSFVRPPHVLFRPVRLLLRLRRPVPPARPPRPASAPPWPDRLSFSPSSHSTAAKPTL